MEKIIRLIQRTRSSGYVQTNAFTTYDIIFSGEFKNNHPEVSPLMEFLECAFRYGLPDREKSPSQMPALMIETNQLFDHPYCKLAFDSGYMGQGNKQHDIVQNYFMENCPECLATEVPLWTEEYSGCADLMTLKLDPFKIGIWDFKPDAKKEKKATGQVYRYVKAAVEQTGIDPKHFEAGYFDGTNFFEVLIHNHL